MRRAPAPLALLPLALTACGGDGDDDAPLTVSAAASLQGALTACAGDARLQFAGSDELAAQVRQGAAILANVRSEEPDVKGVVGKLAQGAADAGFVYATDVEAAGDDLRAIRLPAELDPVATYGAGVVSDSEHREDAEAFVAGLVDGRCHDALIAAGFGEP